MTKIDVISLVVTIIALLSFCAVFTVLFRHYYLSQITRIKEGKEDIDLIDQAIYEEKQKQKKTRKVSMIVLKTVEYGVLAALAFGVAIGVYSRVTKNYIPLGKETMIVVASGSMSKKNETNSYLVENDLNNQFNTYDVVQIRKYKSQSEVKKYDVVAFLNTEGTTIIHRIISIEEVLGETCYITRGDSNNSSDNGSQYEHHLFFENIIGYYTGTRVKTVGVAVVFLQSNSGIVTVLAVLYSLIMQDYLKSKYDKASNERTNTLIELLDFDVKNESGNDLNSSYKETLIYKGTEYRFEGGKFIEKLDSENRQVPDDRMEVIVDNGGVITTKTKTIVSDAISEK